MQTSLLKDTQVTLPNLSEYMNYREYLRDYYNFKKYESRSEYRTYNYAVFSAAADIKSPNYLKLIIEGKRNLSDEMISKFAKALGLNKEKSDEFRLLVAYTQEEDGLKRSEFLHQLNECRVQQKLKTGEIDRKVWEKVPNWVAWVLYAMLDQEGVSFNVNELKTLLRNKASEEEITAALKALVESGEVTQDTETGELKKTRQLMEEAQEIPVALIRKLQSQLMYLGLESLFQDSPTEREFGTLTMSLTKPEFEEIKFQLRKLRKTIHKDQSIKRMQSKGERVYQLSFQLFPVSDCVKRSSTKDH